MNNDFLDKVHQMMEDNCLTCKYCKYSEPLYDEGQLCTRFDISMDDSDYCSYFTSNIEGVE